MEFFQIGSYIFINLSIITTRGQATEQTNVNAKVGMDIEWGDFWFLITLIDYWIWRCFAQIA